MIQDPSKDLTLIIYNSPKPPRYIKINKILMKSLVFLVPAVVIISVVFSMIFSTYMKRQLDQARSQEPQIIIDLKHINKDLISETESLKKSNKELIKKISIGWNKDSDDSINDFVNLFAIPLGFIDERNLNKAKLENMNNDNLNDKVFFKFDILNNKVGNQKLAGFITIVQYHKDGISFYPQYNLSLENPNLIFSKGESFVVSRFRPVVAEFKKPKGSIVWYKIFIYSQTGNLLAYKKAGPFSLD